MSTPPRVLVITPDRVGPAIAGPAIRALEIARHLSAQQPCRLVSTHEDSQPADLGVDHGVCDITALKQEVAAADVVIVQGATLAMHPWIGERDVVVIADMYDPLHLEVLETTAEEPVRLRQAGLLATVHALNCQLWRADLILCASARQRDLWIGQLLSVGRITPVLYDADPTLASLMRIVPFGLSDTPPGPERAVRDVIPGIGRDDLVIVWGGGVYNWFDPLSLIEAVAEVRVDIPEVRLLFMGVGHPNPDVPAMSMVTRVRELSDERGLTGRHVMFNESWVPYSQRHAILADCDIGATTHFAHLETEFAYRTRVLDYLWAGLPVLATRGDVLAGLVGEEGLGRVVEPGDVAGIAAAIRELADPAVRMAVRERIAACAPAHTWSTVLAPLAEFTADPRRAADAHDADYRRRLRLYTHAEGWLSPYRDLLRIRQHWRAGGPAELVRGVRKRLRRIRREVTSR
ncbi:MAG: glycosyltransferase [Actinomycetales bacterium]|nr:glycosyltransferase [Actinomycetales bacterium]